EQRRGHDALLRQVVDDEVHELDLVRPESPAREERGERLLRGLAVESDERPYEEAEAVALLLRFAHVIRAAGAALREHAFQLVEIGAGQGPVHPELPDRDVVLVRAQERAGLRPETLEAVRRAEPRQLDGRLSAEDV